MIAHSRVTPVARTRRGRLLAQTQGPASALFLSPPFIFNIRLSQFCSSTSYWMLFAGRLLLLWGWGAVAQAASLAIRTCSSSAPDECCAPDASDWMRNGAEQNPCACALLPLRAY